MDGYRPLLYSISLLVAWWAQASQSYASLPEGFLRIIVLIISSIYLAYYGYKCHKQKRLFTFTFVLSLSLLPWALFIELLFIGTAPSLSTALVVYNIFRLFLISMVFLILVKEFFKAIKNF